MLTFEELQTHISILQGKNPVYFELRDNTPITEQDWAASEHYLHTRLPLTYRQFTQTYGGGYFAFTTIYLPLEHHHEWSISQLNLEYRDIRENHILFSDNGCGDFYAFKSVNGVCNPEIYFFDHERELWQDTPYKNLYEYILLKALSA
jgi:hypothetical protein